MRPLLALLFLVVPLATAAQFYGYKDQPIPGQQRVASVGAGVDVRVDQRLDEFVPLDARFKDEYGHVVTLESYFTDKPVIVLPVFYRCAGICENELLELVTSLKGFKKHSIGTDFNVVVLGIDPNETPQMASTKKDTMVALYMGNKTDRKKRVNAERGWTFLTGQMPEIRKVTDALGFRFTYDPTTRNIVHPSGLMVLTREGKISRYFLGENYPQRVLLDSILDAGKGNIGVRDDRPFFLACINIDPLTGQKTLNVLNTLKTFGVVTIIGLLAAIVVWNRRWSAQNGAKP